MWWLYFDRPAPGLIASLRTAFVWGYGHYLVFASAAAVGAGLAVAVDRVSGVAHLSRAEVGYAVALPVAVFVLSVWLLQARRRGIAFPAAAALILLGPLTPVPVPATAAVLAVLAVVVTATRRTDPA